VYEYRVGLELSESSSNVDSASVTWLLPATADDTTGEIMNGDGELEWGPRTLAPGSDQTARTSSFTGTTDRDWSDLVRFEFEVEVNPVLAAGEHVAARLHYTDIRREAQYSYYIACIVFTQAQPSAAALEQICGSPIEEPIVNLLVNAGPLSVNYAVNLPVRDR
ncbi:MAG: hypothetical protein LC641_14050, partial [Spirochaeta sp.]|nr:hypothetical protein [Spirochaeta sp.]